MKKTAVITGSSRGIGAATAIKFAEIGFNVVINYNNSKNAALDILERVRLKGGLAIAVKADVSNFSEASGLIEKAVDEFGAVHVLVNNAGIAEQKLFTDLTENDWINMFKINVQSVFNCCRAASPYMIKNHSGKIVNVSSVWGICGAACEVHYSASKAAIIGLTKSLAKELGPSGVNVNCVAPGLIDTDMNSHIKSSDLQSLVYNTPLMRIGKPPDVANLIAFLSSSDADFITGQVIGCDGGFAQNN